MACSICTHPEREAIERALMELPNEAKITEVAAEYKVSATDLKIHAMMHGVVADDKQSVVNKAKCREADVLWDTACDYMKTLKVTGQKISEAAEQSDDIISFGRSLSKPLVDLYLGTGGELRATIKAIAELDSLLNGPQDATASGLKALADAITKSKS